MIKSKFKFNIICVSYDIIDQEEKPIKIKFTLKKKKKNKLDLKLNN